MSDVRIDLSNLLATDDELRARLTSLGVGDVLDQLGSNPMLSGPVSDSPSMLAITHSSIQAALSHTFDITSIGAPEAEMNALTMHSATVVVEGKQRLRLDDQARAAVLAGDTQDLVNAELNVKASGDAATLHGITEPAAGQSHDDTVSAWMRAFLRNEPAQFQSKRPQVLNAALAARAALQEVTNLGENVPAFAEVKRQRDLSELLEPLVTLIGLEVGMRDTRTDRFAGRTEGLRVLRAFVDELESEGLGESISRHVSRASRSAASAFGFAKARLLMLTGRGGMGKSSLIAKFVLSHMESERPLLFAYLDFDRAALRVRAPEQLLIETVRQVALEFPSASESLVAQRERLRGMLADVQSPSFQAECDVFRQNARMLLAAYQARSLVIVLDTTEAVQSDPAAVAVIEQFLRGIVGETGFPELAIVASGRARFPELCADHGDAWTTKELELGPLLGGEAEEMVERLGNALLKEEWRHRWSTMLARGKNAASREPLSLRIAVEIVRNSVADERDRVVRKIKTMGEAADKTFVARLYMTRVQDHIACVNARKLAWPGLVARTLSKEIAAQVLAPLCDLTADEAKDAYDRLAREVWIVTPEANTLRHLPDLRVRMLPLMRQQDAVLFERVASAMAAYHKGKALDPALASVRQEHENEAVYYRLLHGDDPASLNPLWNPLLAAFLSARADDFEPGTPAWVYLRARSANQPLPYREFAALPDELVWWHVARACSGLRGFDDERADARVVNLLRRPASLPEEISYDTKVARQTIEIKGGNWHFPMFTPESVPFAQVDMSALAFAMMVAAQRDTRIGHHQWLRFLKYAITSVRALPLRVMAYSLLPASKVDAHLYAQLDQELAMRLQRGKWASKGQRGALRVAMAVGNQSAREALRHYAATVARPGSVFSTQEIVALTRATDPEMASPYLEVLRSEVRSNDDAPRRRGDELIGSAVVRQLGYLAAHPLPPGSAGDLALREFAALRVEDLAIPVGYAIAMVLGNERGSIGRRGRDVFAKRLRGYDDSGRGFMGRFMEHYPDPASETDPVRVARMAEEAGDLQGLLRDAIGVVERGMGAERLSTLLEDVDACLLAIQRVATRPNGGDVAELSL